MNESPRHVGLFGGSFDPPHVGHVLAVEYVLLTSPVERVFVVPCARHPFGKDHSPFAHRLEMCRIAFAPLGGRAEVLDLESERDGPSYTIDTVRELGRRFPDCRVEVIVGSDILDEIDEWKDADELRRLAELRVLPRLAEDGAAGPTRDGPFFLPAARSSDVRTMIGRGEDVSAHLPREVLRYIRENQLYQS